MQNSHIFHYKSQVQLRDKRRKCQADPLVITTMYVNLMMKLQILILYPLRSLIAFEDLQWNKKIFFGNCHYNFIKYVIIPWEKFDDLVSEQTNNFFFYNSSHELVQGVLF